MKVLIRLNLICILCSLLVSCEVEETSINDIWIGSYSKTMYFDSSPLHSSLSYLLDLTSSDTARLVNLPGQESSFIWQLKDSLLILDSDTNRLVSLTSDSLVYSPYLQENLEPEPTPRDSLEIYAVPEKDKYFVFKRVKGKKSELPEPDLAHLIVNKVFINKDNINTYSKYGDYIYFMDNGVAIFRINLRNSQEVHIQDECWDFINYKGLSFLGFYYNWQQNNGGLFPHAYQITNITTNGFELEKLPLGTSVSYESIMAANNLDSFAGSNWASYNRGNMDGIRMAQKQIDRGIYHIYNDTIDYTFYKDSALINLRGIQSQKFNWRISPDNSLLIFEFPIENRGFAGYHVKYSLIEYWSKDSLGFKFYGDVVFPTQKEKPKYVVVDRSQNLLQAPN